MVGTVRRLSVSFPAFGSLAQLPFYSFVFYVESASYRLNSTCASQRGQRLQGPLELQLQAPVSPWHGPWAFGRLAGLYTKALTWSVLSEQVRTSSELPGCTSAAPEKVSHQAPERGAQLRLPAPGRGRRSQHTGCRYCGDPGALPPYACTESQTSKQGGGCMVVGPLHRTECVYGRNPRAPLETRTILLLPPHRRLWKSLDCSSATRTTSPTCTSTSTSAFWTRWPACLPAASDRALSRTTTSCRMLTHEILTDVS